MADSRWPNDRWMMTALRNTKTYNTDEAFQYWKASSVLRYINLRNSIIIHRSFGHRSLIKVFIYNRRLRFTYNYRNFVQRFLSDIFY